MKENIIINKLTNLMKNYAEFDENSITTQTSLTNDMGMDSFSLVCLIGDIEETFDVNIPSQDLGKFQTLGDMVNYIENHSLVCA